MGIRDSSLTRVKPLFDFIGNDIVKLNKFFQLFGDKIPEIRQGSIKEIRYGLNEKLISPSKLHLIWMLENLGELTSVKDYGVKINTYNYFKRKKLFDGDQEILNEALNLIKSKNPTPKSAWFIFEGYTYPDIYIETDDSIFICEAKRTESDITTKTQWLYPRDQLIRHIDPLLDQPKRIYSFYLLDRLEYQKGIYPQRMELYERADYFNLNLKHRDKSSIQRAMETFIGYIFWDDIAKYFDIKFPDTINNIHLI